MNFIPAMNDKGFDSRFKKSLGLALSIHGFLFLMGGLSLRTQVQYGMASSATKGGQPQEILPIQQTIDLEQTTEDAFVARKRLKAVPTPPTFQNKGAAGSGQADEIPAYYRNPPPPYPEEARALKQEGGVLLRVEVSADGKVDSVGLLQGSGFPLLDESARKTVAGWIFKPARMAGIAVSAVLDIPVRFELTSK